MEFQIVYLENLAISGDTLALFKLILEHIGGNLARNTSTGKLFIWTPEMVDDHGG